MASHGYIFNPDKHRKRAAGKRLIKESQIYLPYGIVFKKGFLFKDNQSQPYGLGIWD